MLLVHVALERNTNDAMELLKVSLDQYKSNAYQHLQILRSMSELGLELVRSPLPLSHLQLADLCKAF